MKGIGKFLDKKYGELVFGLVSGLGYFGVVLPFVMSNTKTGGGLLAFFFAPLIICFPAISLIKLVRNLRENERFGTINLVIYAHILLVVIAAAMLAEMIIL